MVCKFRIPDDSGRVLWEITNQCNYNCKYCIFSSEFYHDDRELTTDECKKVIDYLVDRNFRYLKVSGGEPFVRKDITEILKYAVDKNMVVDVSTNASLINDNIIEKLKEIKLKMIHISMDGFNKETQELVRGNNTFERTINGIKRLNDIGIYLRIGTVIYNGNEYNLEDLVKFAVSLKVNEIIFSIMEPVGRMLNDNTYVFTRDKNEIEKEIKELKEKYQDQIIVNYNWDKSVEGMSRCPAGEKFLYINNLGNIAPCTWLVTQSKDYLSQLSLKDNSLDEVLQDDHIQKFLKYKNSNKCGGYSVK
jgi:MoaA/NifB/PqqE/SkfB family radical SAM enzyme